MLLGRKRYLENYILESTSGFMRVELYLTFDQTIIIHIKWKLYKYFALFGKVLHHNIPGTWNEHGWCPCWSCWNRYNC